MSGGWPPLRNLPEDADWSKLSHTGPNGVFLIMMALSWWASQVIQPALVAEFDGVVEDVNWAFMSVLKSIPTNPAKRSHDGETDEQPKKR